MHQPDVWLNVMCNGVIIAKGTHKYSGSLPLDFEERVAETKLRAH